MKHLIRVIEASLGELLLIRDEVENEQNLVTYVDILEAYLRSDISALLRLQQQAQQDPLLHALWSLRLGIREKHVTAQMVDTAQALIASHPLWAGEIQFVCGFACEIRQEYIRAKDFYYSSYKELAKLGAQQKSLKALHNYISASSKEVPDRAYFAEFSLIYRKAKAIGNWEVAGTTLTNIAREFQKIKAYSSALRYANRSLALLSKGIGTHHQQLALLNRCHILCDLGRYREALIDFESLKGSLHPEVKAGILALESVITNAETSIQKVELHPTWLERLAQISHGADLQVLTELEDRLISLVSCKPRDKYAIIQDLYGEKIDIEAAENRLKNLLNRVRKKRPGLIALIDGQYRIVDGEALEVG